MVDSPLRPGTAVVVSTEGGVEYPGVLAAFNDDFVMLEFKQRAPAFRPGTTVTLELGGRAYESSVARIDGFWLTLARPDDLDSVSSRGAVRLAVTALPVVVKAPAGRVEGQVVDVSASGARLVVPASDDFTVGSTLGVWFRSATGTARIRRVDRGQGDADAGSMYLGLTFEDDAIALQRQLIRGMGGITSDS